MIVGGLMSGCKPKKEISTSTQLQPVPESDPYGDSSMVFVIMTMYRDSITGESHVTVNEKIYAAGRVKSNTNEDTDGANYLTCILYRKDEAIDSVRLMHPLKKQVEYVGEDHQMRMKEISLEKADFSVRFQLTGGENRVTVRETLETSGAKDLISIPL